MGSKYTSTFEDSSKVFFKGFLILSLLKSVQSYYFIELLHVLILVSYFLGLFQFITNMLNI